MIRDEVKLLTLCGCSQIVSISTDSAVIKVPYYEGTSPMYGSEIDYPRYTYRQFRYYGNRDGYRVFREVPESVLDEPWPTLKGRYDSLKRNMKELTSTYRKLWDSVYGVDEGL